MKYVAALAILDDQSLYCAATIVRLAEQYGQFDRGGAFFKEVKKNSRKIVKRRIRHTLNRLHKNHAFPENGDRLIYIFKQGEMKAWYGWRWKKAVGLIGRE